MERRNPLADRPQRDVTVVRLTSHGRHEDVDTAAVEEPLQVVLNGKPFAVIMRTPGEDRNLTAGFLVSERIVSNRSDVLAIAALRSREGVLQHNVLEVTLAAPALQRVDAATRAVTMNASCGLCGRQNVESLVADGLAVRSPLVLATAVARALPGRMREAQRVFDRTGGLHAAALFDPDGTLATIAEDVGRHNAVDKVIGARWWNGDLPLARSVLCVSGRLSYEIVLKALIAGVPAVVAVSAPSTLAIELAEGGGITLAGFVRDGRMNVYTHPSRITP
jgi:FdhD protein